MRAFRSRHARRDRCQHEDAFESFAKNENADVEKCDCRTRIWLRRVRRAMRRDSLPDDHRQHEYRSHEDADSKGGANHMVW